MAAALTTYDKQYVEPERMRKEIAEAIEEAIDPRKFEDDAKLLQDAPPLEDMEDAIEKAKETAMEALDKVRDAYEKAGDVEDLLLDYGAFVNKQNLAKVEEEARAYRILADERLRENGILQAELNAANNEKAAMEKQLKSNPSTAAASIEGVYEGLYGKERDNTMALTLQLHDLEKQLGEAKGQLQSKQEELDSLQAKLQALETEFRSVLECPENQETQDLLTTYFGHPPTDQNESNLIERLKHYKNVLKAFVKTLPAAKNMKAKYAHKFAELETMRQSLCDCLLRVKKFRERQLNPLLPA